ncbi:CD164 sialomucin-like 2 protein [Denticeps clupeoides]|uniref:CD164 sialomucin-like 2 protein n=1 Tax=Denticeps clupeoides TaxID=299321 RepID=UPI0010A45660|nr:CD164 sialomucin-like 2 protein [Denticeps clupeoides]
MRGVYAVFLGVLVMMEVTMRVTSQTTGEPASDCSQLQSCDSCVSGDPAFNLTSCVWRSCENDTACVSAADDAQDCSIFNDTAMCPGYLRMMMLLQGSPLLRPPQFSQASFDLSSFIGGIILVLVLQAGGFFAMRFLKTKDSTYETIDQPQ